MNAESAYKESLKRLIPIFRRLGATPLANIIDDIGEITPEAFLDNIKDMELYYTTKSGTVEGDVVYEDDSPDEYEEKPKKTTKMVNIFGDDYIASNMVSKIMGESSFETYTGFTLYKVRVKCFDGQDIVYPASSESKQSAIINQIKNNLIMAGVEFV